MASHNPHSALSARMRLRTGVAHLPVYVCAALLFVLLAALWSGQSQEPLIADDQLFLLTHPSCPACLQIAASLVGKPVRVLNWADTDERTEAINLLSTPGRKATDDAVGLPVLIARSEHHKKIWQSPIEIASALRAHGLWTEPEPRFLVFTIGAVALAIGLMTPLSSSWVLTAALLGMVYSALAKVGLECTRCQGTSPALLLTTTVAGVILAIAVGLTYYTGRSSNRKIICSYLVAGGGQASSS